MSTAPTPLALSDSQFAAVYRAAAPLLRPDRDAFLCALANVLRGEPQPLGDGAVFRAIRALQREFWTPPSAVAGPNPTRRNVGPALE
jgi:hypothetical protein